MIYRCLLIWLLLSLFCPTPWADEQTLKSVLLTQTIHLKSPQSKPLASAQINHQLLKNLSLIGTVRVSSLTGTNKAIHIAWTTIQVGPKTAIIDHPLISVVKTQKTEIPAGNVIPIKGKIEDVLAAMKQLEKDENLKTHEAKSIQNPQSNDRHVLAPQAFAQNDALLKNRSISSANGARDQIDNLGTTSTQGAGYSGSSSSSNRSSHSSARGGSELFAGFNGDGSNLSMRSTGRTGSSHSNPEWKASPSSQTASQENRPGHDPVSGTSRNTISSTPASPNRIHSSSNHQDGAENFPITSWNPQRRPSQAGIANFQNRNGRPSDLNSSSTHQPHSSKERPNNSSSQSRPDAKHEDIQNPGGLPTIPAPPTFSHGLRAPSDALRISQRGQNYRNLSLHPLSEEQQLPQQGDREVSAATSSNDSTNNAYSARDEGEHLGAPQGEASQTTTPDDFQNSEELTTIYEDCPPRIDEEQERVIHQQKTIIKKGNETIKENQCQDTLTTFLIKRDYNGVGCEDLIDYGARQAFSRYRKYWIDGSGERHALNDQLYVEDHPHPFMDERGTCRASINLETRKAHPQVQTVYYGRGNKRVVIADCHDDPHTSSVDIHETPAQCTPTHDLQALISRINKRDIYVLDGVEHEVKPCHETGHPIAHQFDASLPCKPIKNVAERSIIQTGKRYIKLDDGTRFDISSMCEPFGDKIGLHFSIDGCTGFQNDFVAGKSYPLGRWYYNLGYQKHFVTKCMLGPEAFDHHLEIVGYSHLDDKKLSHPQYKIWLQTHRGNIVIKQQQTRTDREQYPYVFDRHENHPDTKQKPRFEGCYKITPLAQYAVYRRQDGSEYKELIAPAGEKRSSDLCERTSEKRNAFEYTVDHSNYHYDYTHTTLHYHENGNVQFPSVLNGIDVFGHVLIYGFVYKRSCIQVRERVKYPDGHVTQSPWQLESIKSNYVPYCLIREHADYQSRREAYPGAIAPSDKYGREYGTSGWNAGPNRVN